MRTTLDIDPNLLEKIEEITGEKSPSRAVNKALAEFVRKQKLAELRAWLMDPSFEGVLVDNWREMEEVELQEMERQLRGETEADRGGTQRAS